MSAEQDKNTRFDQSSPGVPLTVSDLVQSLKDQSSIPMNSDTNRSDKVNAMKQSLDDVFPTENEDGKILY
jgi:hypothetical protein